MIGFPDKTRDEISQTIQFAKELNDTGIDSSNFFLVMPLPGPPMFNYCIEHGHLPKNYNPDNFQWTKANMDNLSLTKSELEALRDKAWETCNSNEWKSVRKGWAVPNADA